MKLVCALLLAGCIGKPDKPGGTRSWHLVDGAGTPGRLESPRLTWDPGMKQVVMFSGLDVEPAATPYITDSMWSFDGAAWNMICDECITPERVQPGFASDSGRLVMASGSTDLAGHELSSETDVYDNGTWKPLATTGTGPTELNLGQMVAFHDQLWFVGGYNGSVPNSERGIYTLTGSTWAQLPSDTPANFAGDGQIVAADNDHDRIVALDDNAGNGTNDDVWAYANGKWSELCDTCTGTERTEAGLVHIDGADLTLLIGGFANGGSFGGTWVLDEVNKRFVPYDMANPLPPKSRFGVAYDPERDLVVLYGGDPCDNTACAETWVLSRDH